MRIRHVMGAALLVAVVLAGCSSSGSGGEWATSSKQEITTRWEAFWGNKGSAADLQDGNQLQAAYTQLSANPQANGATAKVPDAALLSGADCKTSGVPSPCAKVPYEILSGGQVLLPNSVGYSVKQN